MKTKLVAVDKKDILAAQRCKLIRLLEIPKTFSRVPKHTCQAKIFASDWLEGTQNISL